MPTERGKFLRHRYFLSKNLSYLLNAYKNNRFLPSPVLILLALSFLMGLSMCVTWRLYDRRQGAKPDVEPRVLTNVRKLVRFFNSYPFGRSNYRAMTPCCRRLR